MFAHLGAEAREAREHVLLGRERALPGEDAIDVAIGDGEAVHERLVAIGAIDGWATERRDTEQRDATAPIVDGARELDQARRARRVDERDVAKIDDESRARVELAEARAQIEQRRRREERDGTAERELVRRTGLAFCQARARARHARDRRQDRDRQAHEHTVREAQEGDGRERDEEAAL